MLTVEAVNNLTLKECYSLYVVCMFRFYYTIEILTVIFNLIVLVYVYP